jgi:hypothetical protein
MEEGGGGGRRGEGAAQGDDEGGPGRARHAWGTAEPSPLAGRPLPPCGGEAAAPGRGNRGGRGTTAGEGEGRVWEALHGRKNEEHKGTIGTRMEVFSPGKKTLTEAEEKIYRLTVIRGSDRRTR